MLSLSPANIAHKQSEAVVCPVAELTQPPFEALSRGPSGLSPTPPSPSLPTLSSTTGQEARISCHLAWSLVGSCLASQKSKEHQRLCFQRKDSQERRAGRCATGRRGPTCWNVLFAGSYNNKGVAFVGHHLSKANQPDWHL